MRPTENKLLAVPQTLVKWQPQPIQQPVIDPHLEELNPVARSTECLRHFVLSIEYWLSPNGRLRHWLKINLFLGVWLFIPAVVLMPVVSLVLHEVDGMVTVVTSIVLKLIVLSILVTVATFAIKHFPSSLPGSSRRRK